MKKPYIGVTGITTVKDVNVIKKELGNSYGMYGVLISYDSLRGKPHRNRYADFKNLQNLFKMMPKNALRAVHYNSSFDTIYDDITKIIYLTDGLCNCAQLNVEFPSLNDVRKLYNNNINIIFQLGRDTVLNMNPQNISKKIVPYLDYIDYILIDASCGAGIEINEDITRSIGSLLKDMRTLTFAGGLHGNNLEKFIPLIEEYGASIDAEGRLMNDLDVLDHNEVTNYIKVAKRIKHF